MLLSLALEAIVFFHCKSYLVRCHQSKGRSVRTFRLLSFCPHCCRTRIAFPAGRAATVRPGPLLVRLRKIPGRSHSHASGSESADSVFLVTFFLTVKSLYSITASKATPQVYRAGVGLTFLDIAVPYCCPKNKQSIGTGKYVAECRCSNHGVIQKASDTCEKRSFAPSMVDDYGGRYRSYDGRLECSVQMH